MYYLDMLAETFKQKSFFFSSFQDSPSSPRATFLSVCGSSWPLAHSKRKRSSLGSNADPRTELISFS